MDILSTIDSELGRRYRWEQMLRSSSKGSISLVTGVTDGRKYILKLLNVPNPVYERLLQLPHANLPRLAYVVPQPRQTIIIEEYVAGQSLETLLLRGPFSEIQTKEIALQLCSCLKFLHQHDIVHRDIKPQNIFLQPNGTVKLLDFDAARICKPDTPNDTVHLGTEGYAPPEQYGFAQTDPRSDIYALGITIQELLADEMGPAFTKVVQKATRLDPQDRYQDMQALEWDLTAFEFSHPYAKKLLALLLIGCLCAGGAWWHFIKTKTAATPAPVADSALTTSTTEAKAPVVGPQPPVDAAQAAVIATESKITERLQTEGLQAVPVVWRLEAASSKPRAYYQQQFNELDLPGAVFGQILPENPQVFQLQIRGQGITKKKLFALPLDGDGTYFRFRSISGHVKYYEYMEFRYVFLELLDKQQEVLDFWLLGGKNPQKGVLSEAKLWKKDGYKLPSPMRVQVLGRYIFFEGGRTFMGKKTAMVFFVDKKTNKETFKMLEQ